MQSELKVKCAWCGAGMGVKDGHGVSGTTSGICKKCADKEWAKLGGRPPKRWNVVGRFLWRIKRQNREIASLREIDKQVDERADIEGIFLTNPGLHSKVMLEGRYGIHYIWAADLIRLEHQLDQSVTNYRWN